MQSRPLTIGTRGSPLALAQAHELRDRLIETHKLTKDDIEIAVISTTGDQILDKTLQAVGGKGLFTKEIEEALLSNKIDAAVHSMKDMETRLPDGLAISCILPREDVRDAFISPKAKNLSELKEGATIGTASLRRQAQLLRLRPDLNIITFRGNVQTRLRKLQEGQADATLLACAGLFRLGMEDAITTRFSTDDMLPAVAQGAIAIETRQDDEATNYLLAPLNDDKTSICVLAERAFLAVLDGSCRTPIAGLAEWDKGESEDGESIVFRGRILTPDGKTWYETKRQGQKSEAETIAVNAARELLDRAGPDFFKERDMDQAG